MKSRAFTLIELLVVISIIALLMSVLMPSLNRARKQARSVICQSNLKQWGLVWSIYTNKYDGRFPNATEINQQYGVTWSRGAWIIPLRYEWETDSDILRCAEAQRPSSAKNPQSSSYNGLNEAYWMGEEDVPIFEDIREYSSYGMNCWAFDQSNNIQGRKAEYHWRRISRVTRANTVPLFADSTWRGGGPHYDNDDIAIQPAQRNGEFIDYDYEMSHFTVKRHPQGTNMLFMDGTVRTLAIKELYTQKWHIMFDVNGRYTQEDENIEWPEWIK